MLRTGRSLGGSFGYAAGPATRVSVAEWVAPESSRYVTVTESPTLCAWMAALSCVAVVTATPFTAVIVSPDAMPALAAG